MAVSISSLSKGLAFLSLLLFASFRPSHARIGVKVSEDRIRQICSNTQDPSFCIDSFKSDSRTAIASLEGLLEVAIDLADATLKENLVKIQALSGKASDPETRKRCQGCIKSYTSAMEDLRDARDSLKKKDFARVIVSADACNTFLDDCENGEVTQRKKPFLQWENDKALERCLVVTIVANQLMG